MDEFVKVKMKKGFTFCAGNIIGMSAEQAKKRKLKSYYPAMCFAILDCDVFFKAGEEIEIPVSLLKMGFAVEVEAEQPEKTREELICDAYNQAVEAGNVTSSGLPRVDAMEEILGFDITAEERDNV